MSRRLFACCLAALPLAARAEIVISEIMYHPQSENPAEEYIELYNSGAGVEALGGWRFTSGVEYTIPANTTVPAGGYLVVAADATVFTAKHPGVTNFVAGGWSGRLSNSGNKITLADNLGIVRDEVHYTDDGDWATRQRDAVEDQGFRGWGWVSAADGDGKSLELIQLHFDNSTGQNWGDSTAAGGTPGQPNSIAATDIAPVISDVTHFPLLPKSTELVWVTAKVTDDGAGPVTVNVSYRADGAPAFVSAPMADDGAHQDGLAGDGIYGAQLPVRSDRTVVEYFITAQDGTHTRIWPKPALDENGDPTQEANALYQVTDTVYAGAMPIYRIIMRDADRAILETINNTNSTDSHAKYNATFITVDGTGTELRHLCSVRNRGHGSAHQDPQSFNLKVPGATPWNGREEFNFNSQTSYLQLMGSAIMRKAGIATPDSRQIQLRINDLNLTIGHDAVSNGFYVCNEVQDKQFAEHHFPNDSGGNIYGSRRTDAGTPGYYSEGDFGYFAPPAGEPPEKLYRNVYSKETNVSEDRWDDLISLTQTMGKGHFTTLLAAPTWDADYVTAVEAKVDVAQWMRWMAGEVLMHNEETNLVRGLGDDFYVYFGEVDPRAKLIPHDLDTILGGGDTIGDPTDNMFRMVHHEAAELPDNNTPTPLYPFMRHPKFAQIYFQQLYQILTGPLTVANFNALADQLLTGVVSNTLITARKTWYAQRHAYLLSQIPLGLSVTTSSVSSGNLTISGVANVLSTVSVKVNGVAATYTPWRIATARTDSNDFTTTQGSWNVSGVPMNPGYNWVLIQAFDANGVEIDRIHQDVLRSVTGVVAPTTISTAVTWTAAGGPYRLTGNVTIQSGGTLTIQPGTNVQFTASTRTLTVNAGGRLIAEGTDLAPIRFSSNTGTGTIGGIIINGATPLPAESRIRYAYITGNSGIAIRCNANSNVWLDNIEFGNPGQQFLNLDGASALISNCIFPTTTGAFEGVHSTAAPATGRIIIRDCFFGRANAYNDVIDYTGGNRPSPIFQFYNNVCIGSDDDVLDLDSTDAWVEGNIFMNIHKNGSPDSSSGVSGGKDNADTSQITIVGNLFYNVDQAATGKQTNFYTLLNNTIVHQTKTGGLDTEAGAINLGDSPTAATDWGSGMYLEGNIIYDAELLVRNYSAANSQVTFKNNLLPFPWAGPGDGNLIGDPLFVDAQNVPTPTKDNYKILAPLIRAKFALKPASPARAAGPNGTDLGAIRPIGVSLGGAPIGKTNSPTATITVGTLMTGNGIPNGAAMFPNGSGWTHYQWRLNGGAFSAETPIATPIALSGLTNGVQTLEVIGKNDAGTYQNDPQLDTTGRISTATWTVDISYTPPAPVANVRINEVLANNIATLSFGTQFPDIIELYNAGTAAADLSGWGLSDSSASPYKYTIASGTTLPPGGYLVLYASSNAAVPLPRTGFSLKQSGDDLTLTRSVAQGGGTVDYVVWGSQLPDFSIARRLDGSWGLGQPTFGAANKTATASPPAVVRINEWLADARTLFGNDFIELYNPSALPVDLSGCFLTDNPAAEPTKHQLAALSFIGAGGYVAYTADGDPEDGPDHLDFKLDPVQGDLALFASDGSLIDVVVYGPQSTDVSQGRSPNGALSTQFFTQPTPGAPNPGATTSTTPTVVNLISATQGWKYFASPTGGPENDAADRPWTDALYDDVNTAGWLPSGAGNTKQQALYVENNNALTNTEGFVKEAAPNNNQNVPAYDETHPYQTYYFRTKFTYSGQLSGVTLEAKLFCDDGCVIYLNGKEVRRLRVTDNPVVYTTQAGGATDGVLETLSIPADELLVGENVLVASVHQNNTQSATGGSTDMVWAFKLNATVQLPGAGGVVLNEMLASNATFPAPDSTTAGWLELYNTSGQPVDLADFSLTDDLALPRKYIIPAGTTLATDGYARFACNGLTAPAANNTGFALSPAGGRVYLFLPLSQGGALGDSVAFGQQVVDFSVARVPNAVGPFSLAVPTPGALNTGAALGALTAVKINEWAVNPGLGQPTWFELYNTASQPVLLSGNYLTDHVSEKTKFLVPPLTYLGGNGSTRWLQLFADNDTGSTPNHVNFTLEPGEVIGLYTGAGFALDTVGLGTQPEGVTEGRSPDGSSAIISMPPTPGAANATTPPETDTDHDGLPDSWEIANGLNPNDPTDATRDADQDGQSNFAEYLAGTNPQQFGSRLAAQVLPGAGAGQFVVRFTATAGKTYTVRYKNEITGAWTKLSDVPAQATDTAIQVNDFGPSPNGRRFYQVVTPQQP